MDGNVFMQPIKQNVIDKIVENDLCCQCGVCVAMCPKQVLNMAWSPSGDLTPELSGECNGCNVCLSVCPFAEGTVKKQDDSPLEPLRSGFNYDKDLGSYLQTLVAYSCENDQRENGASGGMVTWLLEELINKNIVDAVICVGNGDVADRLFSYKICFNHKEVREASGSKYYPVSLENVLEHVKSHDYRYAVVGLPCRIQGLYRAMNKLPELKQRINYTIGLTCGHLPNKYYTEYLANKAGIATNYIQSINYRQKDQDRPASNYGFTCRDSNGKYGSTIYFSQIEKIWHNGFFQVNACNFCQDVFAELADVSMMDAWLPEFARDYRGHSLLVVRNHLILELIKNGSRENRCVIESIDKELVKRSQQGVIFNKTILIKGKAYWALKHGKALPDNGICPSAKIYKKHRVFIDNSLTIQQESKVMWPKYRDGRIKEFDEYFKRYNKWFLLYKLKYYLMRIIGRLS